MEAHLTNYMGLNLNVIGTYYEGSAGSYFSSPKADTFEIESVLIEDKVEIIEMLENSYDRSLTSLLYSLEQQILDEQYR